MPEAISTFTEGMIMDVHPLMTPNNMLTNALNATVITFNGNEFMLQNDMGNGRVETAFLPTGYVPVGVKEYGGIIYVASYNPLKNQSQLGCFPSPERLISSDELSDLTQTLTNDTFGWTNASSGMKDEYKKLEVFDSSKIFNPGDQFMIALRQLNFNDTDGHFYLNKILSFYNSDEYKDVTIHLASLDDSGNIVYIEKDLLKDKTSNYWMPYLEEAITTLDPTKFRESIGNSDKYNIFKSKTSGLLVLIVELEGMRNFDLTRTTTLLYEGSTNESDTFKVTFTGSSDKYTSSDSSDYNGFEITCTLYEDGQEIETVKKYRNEGIVSRPPNSKIDLSLDASNNGFDILSTSGFKRNQILRYTAIPFTDFLYLPRLRKSGIVDFSKINSGIHDLTEWRYYVDTKNNNIAISFGFDYNPLEGVNVDKVFFEFYDVSADYSLYYPVNSRDNWSGNFIDNIPLNTLSQTDATDIDTYDPTNSIPIDLKDILIPSSRRYKKESSISLKPNNLYIVRVAIRETYIEDNETKYKTKNFYKYLYTTELFNENYINDFDTITDFSTLTPKISASVITKKENEDSYLYNKREVGGYFKILTGIPESEWPSLLVTDTLADINVKANLELDNSLNNPSKYFGTYNKNAFNIKFSGPISVVQPLNVSVSNPTSIPRIISGTLSESMDTSIRESEDTTVDNTTGISKSFMYPIQSDGSRIKITNSEATKCEFYLRGQVGRRIVGDTEETLIEFEGRKLEQFFKSDYFGEDFNSNKTEIDKRIACLSRLPNPSNTSEYRLHFQGNVFGISKSVSGPTDYRSNGSAGVVLSRYTGPIDDYGLLKCLKDLVNEGYYKNPPVIPVCGTNDKQASLRYTETGRSGLFPWHSSGELDAVSNYIMVAWQVLPGATGFLDKEYILMNMGTKHGNFYDTDTRANKPLPLGHAVAKVLSYLYLVQYDDFKDPVLISNNQIYHGTFDTTYSGNIPILIGTTINDTFFKFSNSYGTSINFYNDSLDVIKEGFIGYLQTVVSSSSLSGITSSLQNNIPTNKFDSNVTLSNQLNSVAVEYKFGSTIRLTEIFNKYQDPTQSAKIELASKIVDENGSTKDSNGKDYVKEKVYVRNPYVYSKRNYPFLANQVLLGTYPINELGSDIEDRKGLRFPELNDSTKFWVLGAEDGNRLVASYSVTGGNVKGELNIPLIDVSNPGSRARGEWVEGGDKEAPDLKSDLTFSDTYNILSISSTYATKHSNTIR